MTSNIIRTLVDLDDSAPHTLSSEYRLTATAPLPGQNPFPAALLDALAGYNYLANEIEYSPPDTILVGDSLGGNLALVLTRYFVESKNTPTASLLVPPGHLILLSHLAGLTTTHDWPGSSTSSNTTDYLEFHGTGRSLYSKIALPGPFDLGFAFHNGYISLLRCFPQTVKHISEAFLATGTAERMYDATRTLERKMAAEMGEGQVTYFEGKDAAYDFLVFTWYPCRPAALEAI